jgi:hypothetical protein
MSRDELETLWWALVYVGGLVGVITFLRTVFVPPGGAPEGKEKSPFQLWLEFSRERAQHELEADLEKYRIDRGIHRSQDARDQTP